MNVPKKSKESQPRELLPGELQPRHHGIEGTQAATTGGQGPAHDGDSVDREAQLRQVLEQMPYPVEVTDAGGTATLVNQAFLGMMGIPSADLVVGKYNCFDDPFVASMGLRDKVQRVYAGEVVVIRELAVPAGMIGPQYASQQQGMLYQEITMFPVFSRSGRLSQVVTIWKDITAQKRAEEERLGLERQLQHAQKLESLGVLAGGIAHDLNNLLVGILGNADLALQEMSPVSVARRYVEGVLTTARRAADLSQQMLAYSGKGRFVIEPVNLSEVVSEMAHMLEVSISKKASLKLSLAQSMPMVEADATQLRQVILNLLTNASDAIGDNSGVISVVSGSMTCDRAYFEDQNVHGNPSAGTYAFIEVSDTGCGMDTQTSAKLFDPFFSTKHTGRGLGLAAVQGIVRSHQGAIKVYGEPGRGTTFKVLLPTCDKEAQITSDSAQGPTPSFHGSGLILLVDDDETVRTVGTRMLEKLGFEVMTASDGREAVQSFTQSHDEVVCVILDLTMPNMGGAECFRELRRIKKDVHVILSSGYNEMEVVQNFVGKGVAAFIQKPYQMKTLKAKLAKVLGPPALPDPAKRG